MNPKSYILFGIKDGSKHLIDHNCKLREIVNTAEYILLKTKEYTYCEIHDEEGIVWAATTNMLNKEMFVVYPVPNIIDKLFKTSVEEKYGTEV